MTILADRYYGIGLIECRNGNPNGDPDAGNRPRTDLYTGFGLISDVAIKRKIRDYLAIEKNLPLYHSEGAVLREVRRAVLTKNGHPIGTSDMKMDRKVLAGNLLTMASTFIDVRLFGAMLDLKDARAMNARGPIWLSIAQTVSQIDVSDLTIARQSVEEESERKANKTFGSRWRVPYGLYKFEFEINPNYAPQVGFTTDDLDLFKEALVSGVENDHASGRKLDFRGLHVFRVAAQNGRPSLGVRRATLRDRVSVKLNENLRFPTDFTDYKVDLDLDDLPESVEYSNWLD